MREFVLVFILPMVLIIIGAIVFELLGYHRMALTLALPGSLTVAMGSLLYVTTIDSKKRWPQLSWTERFEKIITFRR